MNTELFLGQLLLETSYFNMDVLHEKTCRFPLRKFCIYSGYRILYLYTFYFIH